MPSLLDLPPPQISAADAWDSMHNAQEPAKPRHTVVFGSAAVPKKPVYYGSMKKNLETCTEALGCETGAVDAAPANNDADKGDREVEAELEERTRCGQGKEEEVEGRRARRQSASRHLPPPLTTLARRVRMVHERRDGRLAVYAVPAHGVEAERSGGRLRMRLVSLPCGAAGSATATCRRQEPQEAEAEAEAEAKEEVEGGECGGAKYYVRAGRCVEAEGAAAAAARRGKQWEQELAAAFWVATSLSDPIDRISRAY